MLPPLKLKYGNSTIDVPLGNSNYLQLLPKGVKTSLTRAQLEEKLDHPLNSSGLSELATKAASALLIVSDATRNARADLLLPLIIRRLAAGGISENNIAILFARGNHREVTPQEVREILGADFPSHINIFQHDSSDRQGMKSCGNTSAGTEILLNKKLFQYDLVITISSVSTHYFAGFGGGRKSIFPGLGGKESIIKNHLLSIDFDRETMAEGVEPGKLEGNRVHEDFLEIVAHRLPDFSLNVILSESSEVGHLFAGHWLDSHLAACAEHARLFGVSPGEKADAAIVSCGGFPKDIDLIQSLKTIQYSSRILNRGGRLLLLAECHDGIGSEGFESYFPMDDRKKFLELLKKGNLKNGQTALALNQKTREFRIGMITSLPSDLLQSMGISHLENLDTGLEWLLKDNPERVYAIPQGAVTLPTF